MQHDQSFKTRTVLITGGSRGLGLALADEFLFNGAKVAIIARDLKELKSAKLLLEKKYPGKTVFISDCDITDEDKTERALENLIKKVGTVDVLVNNAGAILVSPYDSLTEADFRAQMELHVFAVIRLTRLIVDHFRETGNPGRIVNICSLGGKIAVPHMLTYDTSKFALAGFSQGITAELAGDGISVTTIYPTVMRTGSPIQAVFKGAHEKEFAWFSTTDSLPGLSMSAGKAAKKIVRAAALRKTELIPSLAAKVRLAVGVFFPETMAWTMKTVAGFMPQGQSHEYKTGAQSQSVFKKSEVYKILKNQIKKSEIELNQKAKQDGKFNLGVKP